MVELKTPGEIEAMRAAGRYSPESSRDNHRRSDTMKVNTRENTQPS